MTEGSSWRGLLESCRGWSPPLRWRRPLRRRPNRTSMPASPPRKFSPTPATPATAARGKSSQPVRASCGNIIPPAGGKPRPWPLILPRSAVMPGGPAAAATDLGRGPGGRAGERPRQRPSDVGAGPTLGRRGHGGRGQASSSLRERGSGQSADRCSAGRRARGWSAASCRGDTGTAERCRRLRGIAPRPRRRRIASRFALRACKTSGNRETRLRDLRKLGCLREIEGRYFFSVSASAGAVSSASSRVRRAAIASGSKKASAAAAAAAAASSPSSRATVMSSPRASR